MACDNELLDVVVTRENSQHFSTPLHMTCYYPDLSSACYCLKQISLAGRPIGSTTQIWVVTRDQYGISALVPQTSSRRETSGSVAKWRQFSQANVMNVVAAEAISQSQIDDGGQDDSRKTPPYLNTLMVWVRTWQSEATLGHLQLRMSPSG